MKRKCNWLAAILFLVLLCGCDGRQGDLLLAQAIYQEQEAQAVQLRILCLESEPSANAEDAQPKPVLLAGKGVTLEEAWQAAAGRGAGVFRAMPGLDAGAGAGEAAESGGCGVLDATGPGLWQHGPVAGGRDIQIYVQNPGRQDVF